MLEPSTEQTYHKQVLALTGIFQAAGLLHTIAKGQYENQDDLQTSMRSLFVQNPETLEACFPGMHLSTGQFYLKQFFGREYNPNIIQVSRYVFSLFKLYRLMKKQPTVMKAIQQHIDQAQDKLTFFQDPLSPNIMEYFADGYSEILGELSFRIQIIGKKIVLNDPTRLAKMRSLLFAGIRSVVLWQQLGGSLWKLFFYRKKYIKAHSTLAV